MNSKEFIWNNRKVLIDGADYFNPDTTLMTPQDFENKKLKVLIIFPTPHYCKAVSSTAAALNDYVVSNCPDVFIDFWDGKYPYQDEFIKLLNR